MPIIVNIHKGQPDTDPIHVRNGEILIFHSKLRHSRLTFDPNLNFQDEDIAADQDGLGHRVHARRGTYKYSIKMDGEVLNDPMIIVDDGPRGSGDDSDMLLERALGDPTPAQLASALQTLAQDSIATIKSAATERDGKLFFPNGITLIDVSIEVGGVKAEVKISGPPNN